MSRLSTHWTCYNSTGDSDERELLRRSVDFTPTYLPAPFLCDNEVATNLILFYVIQRHG